MRPALSLVLAGAAGVLAAVLWIGQPPAAQAPTPLPIYDADDLTPRWVPTAELPSVPAADFPELRLQDQSGRSFTRADLQGRIVAANFFFTGCSTLCPRLTSAMARVRDAHADTPELLLLSHSVTPQTDSPPVLAAYARANRVDGERWRLLTGAPAELERLLHAGYRLPREPAAPGRIAHTELFVLLDGRQRVRGYYNGTLALEVEHLIRDIRTLREEAQRLGEPRSSFLPT